MHLFAPPTTPVLAPFGTPINLDDATAVHRVCAQLPALPPEARTLRVDCQQLVCQRTLGVSYVVSQLLLLRRAGAALCLHRVNPVLRHCLELLCVDELFWMEPAE